MLLVFASPFLSWIAAALLIHFNWIKLDLKRGFSDMDMLWIFFAAFALIVLSGWLMGLLRAGWLGVASLMLLGIGVSGLFAWIQAGILFPVFAWPGAAPAIVFLITVLNWKPPVRQNLL